MSGKRRVLLVLDFTGVNFPSALYALQQWSQYVSLSKEYETLLGPTTFGHRRFDIGASINGGDALAMMARCCQGMKVVCWDRYVDKIALDALRGAELTSQPFYLDFNYGSLVNRCLLLASELDCDFMVRIDPGTRPPEAPPDTPEKDKEKYSFDSVLGNQIREIDAAKGRIVISRGYEGRLSVRDIYVRDKKAAIEQVKRLRELTGINAEDQVTGGAMFTAALPGTPAIPFEASKKGLTLVWGSDDALFQGIDQTKNSRNLCGTSSQIPESERIWVPRFDPVGKPKPTTEYYRALAGTVFLAGVVGLHERPRLDVTEARRVTRQFLEQLKKDLLDPEKCRKTDDKKTADEWEGSFDPSKVAPDEFLDKIKDGVENYGKLVQEWEAILDRLKGRLYPHVHIS